MLRTGDLADLGFSVGIDLTSLKIVDNVKDDDAVGNFWCLAVCKSHH